MMTTHVNVPSQPKDKMYKILYNKERNGETFTREMATEFNALHEKQPQHGTLVMYAKILTQPTA